MRSSIVTRAGLSTDVKRMSSPWLRVDPTIHIHFQADANGRRGLLVESIRQQAPFGLFTTAILRALALAGDWITRSDYQQRLVELGLEPDRAIRFIDDLLAHGLLQQVEHPRQLADRDERARRWAASGCMATATLLDAKCFQRYLDYERSEAWMAEQALMRAYRDAGAPPDICKQHPEAEVHELPSPSLGVAPPLTLEWLAALLRHAFGATGIIEDPVQGQRLRKTHPSGGARHPVECYLASLDVGGLASGIHHYAVASHSLERLPGDPASLLAELLPDQRVPLLVILTVTPARVMWRYREPTSFFAMMLDVGHALENFCAVCRADRIAHEALTSVPMRALARQLHLNWLAEPPVAALAITGVA
jgi:SagB-type dehydrogenase family enzyme